MGFSVVSLIELFYFMSLRPYSNFIRISHKRRQAFGRVFQRFGNLRLRKRPAEKPQPKQVDNVERVVVFPFVN